MRKVRKILFSWDFGAAISVTVVIFLCSSRLIPSEVAKDLYSTAISVLSILFSVFFASLAIIMASSEDEFVEFLELKGDYSELVWSFEFSLGLLFVALLASIGFFAYTASCIPLQITKQSHIIVTAFAFLFFYSLFAAAASVLDSITYSRFRAEFLSIRSREKRTAAHSGQ